MTSILFTTNPMLARATAALSAIVLAPAAEATFLPPNTLHLHPTPLERSNVSEQQFNAILSQIEAVYAPIVEGHKAKLKINRLWKDNTVNASASQSGKTWVLNMYGGLARRPEVTPDGFALVVCHELGHHLGGFAFWHDNDWAANEGQSDYFSAQSCAREIWKGDLKGNSQHAATVNQVAKSTCEKNFTDQNERNLCFRRASAGLSLASLLAATSNENAPRFDTPSTEQVDFTADAHPKAQCRLDTFLAASVCSTPFNPNIIPGKNLPDRYGTEAELEAGKYSCMAHDGWISAQRPRCWFKPSFEFMGLVAEREGWRDASGNGHAEPGEALTLTVPLANRWNRTNEAVSGELFSRTPGVAVTSARVEYPDIVSQSVQAPLQPFTLTVAPDFVCGRPFELLFRATSKYGAREFPITWFVGPKQSEPVVIGGRTDATSIDDFPAEAVAIPMTTQSAAEAAELELTLQLVAMYTEEIEFTLTTPQGKTISIPTANAFDAYGNARVKIPLGESVPLRGTWFLKARDLQPKDLATIANFELRAPLAEKVVCTQSPARP
jgi:hypothetical protein